MQGQHVLSTGGDTKSFRPPHCMGALPKGAQMSRERANPTLHSHCHCLLRESTVYT